MHVSSRLGLRFKANILIFVACHYSGFKFAEMEMSKFSPFEYLSICVVLNDRSRRARLVHSTTNLRVFSRKPGDSLEHDELANADAKGFH